MNKKDYKKLEKILEELAGINNRNDDILREAIDSIEDLL